MPTIADTLVIDRPPRLVRLLDWAPQLGHEHNWEGALSGLRGAAQNCEIGLKARIAFHGDLIEGVGRMVNRPEGMPDFNDGFTLSGTLIGDSVDFQLWFAEDLIAREPFAVSGQLSLDARDMVGDWTVRCFNPTTCGCDGGGGDFRLKRVD
jgi:hypothetical protein